MQVSIVVEEAITYWGYRKSVRVETPRGGLVAAFDEWENCLGGSCRGVEEVLESLDNCTRLFAELLEEDELGVKYRVVYECPEAALRLGGRG
ncbi:MAG: hypothetical protein GSR80_001494 [Desulfurococcales archaeon]|nr:hypothetical protein [Desulfurococcales archaeon]